MRREKKRKGRCSDSQENASKSGLKKGEQHFLVQEVGVTAKGGYRYRVGRFDTQGGGREGLLRIVHGEWTVLDSP